MDYRLPSYTAECLHQQLKVELDQIRTGTGADVFGWNYIV
jgi:hypothetical protein